MSGFTLIGESEDYSSVRVWKAPNSINNYVIANKDDSVYILCSSFEETISVFNKQVNKERLKHKESEEYGSPE